MPCARSLRKYELEKVFEFKTSSKRLLYLSHSLSAEMWKIVTNMLCYIRLCKHKKDFFYCLIVIRFGLLLDLSSERLRNVSYYLFPTEVVGRS